MGSLKKNIHSNFEQKSILENCPHLFMFPMNFQWNPFGLKPCVQTWGVGMMTPQTSPKIHQKNHDGTLNVTPTIGGNSLKNSNLAKHEFRKNMIR